MSKVHEALRRAEIAGTLQSPPTPAPAPRQVARGPASAGIAPAPPPGNPVYRSIDVAARTIPSMKDVLALVQEVPFQPLADAHLLDASRPSEAPAEEFRSLRTRLNHLQSLTPIHNVVVTSPSPAEGKSFTAVNLALAEAQLSGNMTLLADFDFRRPIVHSMFQVDRSPGITDYLMGKAELHEVIKKIAGTNLYIMPAGEAVLNPLELLNLEEVKVLFDCLPTVFNWVILDTPPLLFAADANLLSTLCHGTVLVVRIGTTTIDSVTRAMQSLCENNVLGIAVNGARRGELYSKYTYYHSYYYAAENARAEELRAEASVDLGDRQD
jgi:protein-tyrosine kinase